jgi:hypothetical protein
MVVFLARYEVRAVDDEGNVVPNASVRVRSETSGRPNALLYANRTATTPKGNPFVCDEDGKGFFYVTGGAYSIEISSGEFSDEVRYVAIGTMGELDQEDAVFGQFDAYGQSSDLSTYDGENEGFTFWAADAFEGDGGWYVRSDDPEASSGWYGPFTNKGPRGGDAYDLFFFDPDRPVSNELLQEFPFTRIVTFPAGLLASKARAGVAPTAEAVYHFMKNGVEWGTCTFAAGETEGVFAAASDATFDPDEDDILAIYAPLVQDATIRRVAITLAGFRPT